MGSKYLGNTHGQGSAALQIMFYVHRANSRALEDLARDAGFGALPPASQADVARFVREVCVDSLSSAVRRLPLGSVFNDWIFDVDDSLNRPLLKGRLMAADAAVVDGDFRKAADLYGRAMDMLGWEGHPGKCSLDDHGDLRLESKVRWDMARAIIAGDGDLSMANLLDDPQFDDWRDLELGSFSLATGDVRRLDDLSRRCLAS